MKKPTIIVNFKNHKKGKGVLKLAKQIQKVDKDIMIAIPDANIKEVTKKTKLKIYTQQLNLKNPVKTKATLLNHSEHPLKFRTLKRTISFCKKLKLKTVVCIPNLKTTKKILKLNPTMIAFEVPELIGTGKSISKYRPSSVKKFSHIIRIYNQKEHTKIKPLCGAGISNRQDVASAIELGCDGVLLSSAVTKSKQPGKLLKSMVKI